MVPVDGAGRRVDESSDLRITRCDQHVQRAIDVRCVGVERLRDRPRHGPERRLMQHEVRTLARFTTGREIADVTLDETVPAPRVLANRCTDVIEVAQMPGRKIVERHDVLPGGEQGLDQVRADEAGRTRHEPAPTRTGERVADDRVTGLRCVGLRHHRRQTPMPRSANAFVSACAFTSTSTAPGFIFATRSSTGRSTNSLCETA